MTTIFQIKKDGSLVCLRTKLKRPNRKDYKPGTKGQKEFDTYKKKYQKSFEEYSVKDRYKTEEILFKEHTKDQISVAGDGGLRHALSKGIQVENNRVTIEKYGICCWTSKDYPYHGPHCDSCQDYKDGYHAVLKP